MKLPKTGRWAEMITYDYAICELCGKKYQSVSSHIRQTHGINDINEYKDEFGYNHNQPLESGRLQERRRQSNLDTKGYENIEEANKKYRFQKGYKKERKYNEQHIDWLREEAKFNNTDEKRLIKRGSSLSKSVRERIVRDDNGRFKNWGEKA